MPTIIAFADVVGFPGYVVGTDGSVWTWWKSGYGAGTWRDTPRQLKPGVHWRNGQIIHLSVFLYGEDGPRNRFVHRLVLEAFIGPCPPGLECRHIDGDPSNNWLDNLCWETHDENDADKKRHGRQPMGSKSHLARLHEDDIPVIRRLLADGFGQTMIARRFGVARTTISSIATGRNWAHIP